jgi:Cu/Ag efflux pump CusA
MQFENKKVTFATVWVVAMVALGFAANVTSLSGWTILAGLAALPPIVMLRFWSEPAQSMSESIREARR